MTRFLILGLVLSLGSAQHVMAKSPASTKRIGIDGRMAVALSRHFQKSSNQLDSFKYDIYCYSDFRNCTFTEPDAIATVGGNSLNESSSRSIRDIIFIATASDEREFQAKVECEQNAKRCIIDVGPLGLDD